MAGGWIYMILKVPSKLGPSVKGDEHPEGRTICPKRQNKCRQLQTKHSFWLLSQDLLKQV